MCISIMFTIIYSKLNLFLESSSLPEPQSFLSPCRLLQAYGYNKAFIKVMTTEYNVIMRDFQVLLPVHKLITKEVCKIMFT